MLQAIAACAAAVACGSEAVPPLAPASSGGCAPLMAAAREPEPLSQLLRRLADTQGFRLEYWAAEDPPVRHGGGSAVEVIGALARDANMVVHYAPQPKGCAAPWRVSAVWVLRTGPATVPGARAPLAPALPDPAADAFLRAHGMAPPGPAAPGSSAAR